MRGSVQVFLIQHKLPFVFFSVGFIQGIPRLGIPPINLEDGPQGVADGMEGVTAWPSSEWRIYVGSLRRRIIIPASVSQS